MVKRDGVGEPEGGASARVPLVLRRGLRVFGVFVAIAVVFFIVTFGPFKSVDGMRELPLPEWAMMIPTLVSLGAGVVAGLVAVVVDLVRGRRSHRDGPEQSS